MAGRNHFFRFKEFVVHQEHCAMKVTTDACILGALAEGPAPQHILDIGTGTGLLALMLAQRYQASVTGVELVAEHVRQAQANFSASPWADRLAVVHCAAQDFAAEAARRYDLIVSNPPFFTNAYKSPDARKNVVRHTDLLPYSDLAVALAALLLPEGQAFVLLPPDEMQVFEREAAQRQLFVRRRWLICQKPGKAPYRCIVALGFDPAEAAQYNLYVHDQEGKYSADFETIMRPYYLAL